MDLQRQDLNHKPSCSKSQSVWRGGTLNGISAHDVLVDHCYTTTSGWCYHRINCQQSGLSQTIQPPVCTSLEKVAIIVMCMGNWTRLTDIVVCKEEWQYRYHWLRVQAEVGSSEYQTNSTDSTKHQSSKLGLRSPVFKAEQLIINFTELQCVLIINCQPQTVQAAICRLVPNTEWSGGKTRLFQAMLSRQHRWIDLQWLSTIGSLPLPPNSFPSNV